jgi:hypothetical protein
MHSLALIIFVVSEKKAFEHFPIGSNVNLCSAVVAILDFRSATLDPMVKCSNAFFSETTNMIKAKLHECSLGGPLQTLGFLFQYKMEDGGYSRT